MAILIRSSCYAEIIDLLGHSHGGYSVCLCACFPRLLLVGGCESGDDSTSKASCCGITAWRALSGSPHYKQVTSYEDDVNPVRRPHTHAHVHARTLKQHLTYTFLSSVRIRREASSRSPASDSSQDKEMKRYRGGPLLSVCLVAN